MCTGLYPFLCGPVCRRENKSELVPLSLTAQPHPASVSPPQGNLLEPRPGHSLRVVGPADYSARFLPLRGHGPSFPGVQYLESQGFCLFLYCYRQESKSAVTPSWPVLGTFTQCFTVYKVCPHTSFPLIFTTRRSAASLQFKVADILGQRAKGTYLGIQRSEFVPQVKTVRAGAGPLASCCQGQ